MAGGINSLISQINGSVQLSNGLDFIPSSSTEIDTSTVYGQIDAYTKCAVVQDAIDIKASYHSTLRIAAINSSGRWLGGSAGTKSEISTINQDLAKMEMFNEHENFTKFNHHLKSILSIFGIAYIQKVKIVGFDKYNHYIIPNDLVLPIYSGKKGYDVYFNAIPEKYQITLPNGTIDLYPDEVFIIRDTIKGFGLFNSHLSRLVALKEPISAILSSNQMFTQLIADGGARGIIGLGAKDAEMAIMLDDEKSGIQRVLKQYGKLRGQLKYIVTKGASSYTPLTSSIVDMQLPENILAKKIDIYRAYGIPTAFAVNEARFQVVPEAIKILFTSSVTPEGKSIYDDLFRMKEIPKRDWIYTADDSHHDFFQKSLKDSSIAFQQAAGALVPLLSNGIITQQQSQDYLDPYLTSQR